MSDLEFDANDEDDAPSFRTLVIANHGLHKRIVHLESQLALALEREKQLRKLLREIEENPNCNWSWASVAEGEGGQVSHRNVLEAKGYNIIKYLKQLKENKMQPREFYIAGVKFHNLKDVISSLTEGDEMEMVPEPDNKFDSNAVQLIFNGTMCGYVPKTYSAEISASLEVRSLICEVLEVNPQAKTYEQVKVRIREVEDKDDYTPFDADTEEDEDE